MKRNRTGVTSVERGIEAAGDRKSSVQSLSKGLRVLETVARSDEPLTLSEVSRGSDLDAGTCFRMLNTLVDDGYLRRVEGRRFALTLKVLDLGHRAIARRDIRGTVRPLLRALVSQTSEAASFAVLEGSDVLYVERVRAGFARLGVDIQVGTTVPAHSSVIGRAMLAFVPEKRLTDIKAESSRSAALDPKLEKILRTIRKDGHYASHSLLQNGLFVVAAPVLDADQLPVGAISVAAPALRASARSFEKTILASLVPAAKDLGRALEAGGFTAP